MPATTSGVSLRLLSASDRVRLDAQETPPGVAQVWPALWPDINYQLSVFSDEDRVRPGMRFMFVILRDDATAVGVVSISRRSDPGEPWVIRWIGVPVDLRNVGYGKQALRLATTWACAQSGLSKVLIEPMDDAMRHIAEKYGGYRSTPNGPRLWEWRRR
jgi:RimJ/RimL family protein N-acetyltransferase